MSSFELTSINESRGAQLDQKRKSGSIINSLKIDLFDLIDTTINEARVCKVKPFQTTGGGNIMIVSLATSENYDQ